MDEGEAEYHLRKLHAQRMYTGVMEMLYSVDVWDWLRREEEDE